MKNTTDYWIPEPIEQAQADALITDIVAVCKKHGIWLSHEDGHGGFLISRVPTDDWLEGASIARIFNPDYEG